MQNRNEMPKIKLIENKKQKRTTSRLVCAVARRIGCCAGRVALASARSGTYLLGQKLDLITISCGLIRPVRLPKEQLPAHTRICENLSLLCCCLCAVAGAAAKVPIVAIVWRWWRFARCQQAFVNAARLQPATTERHAVLCVGTHA